MSHPVFHSGNRALITGGASGVGLAIAKACVGHGMRVAIVDVNKEKLAAAKAELAAFKAAQQVEAFEADVSRWEAWETLRGAVSAAFGGEGIELLVLNAGIGVRHDFASQSSAELVDTFRRVMDVNLMGYVNGLAAMLPAVKAAQKAAASKSDATAIVLTGSKQGITNPPGNPAYNASKAAVRAVAEQLDFELRGSGTSVHLLVPGWTFTGMTRGSSAEKPAGAWLPEQVAQFLERKMAARSFYVVCPDNDVTEDLDRRRMLYSAGDAVHGRPPLSRWREDWKERAQSEIDSMKL